MIKYFTALLILIGVALHSNGQSSATSSANATIVTPIGIMKTVDLKFGNIAVSPTNTGTVVVTPTGTRSATGGVTLPANAGTVTSASFVVSGQGVYTYSITLPSSAIVISNGSSTMTVSSFTSVPATTGALIAGTQTLTVGATLNVASGQPAGVYTSSTPFNVSVNYN